MSPKDKDLTCITCGDFGRRVLTGASAPQFRQLTYLMEYSERTLQACSSDTAKGSAEKPSVG